MAAKPGKLPVGTFEQIASASDLGEGQVHEVPEWGISLKIRGLTRGEARLLSSEESSPEDKEVSVLLCGVVEPKLEPDQARKVLQEKAVGPTERLIDAILELSGMGDTFRNA